MLEQRVLSIFTKLQNDNNQKERLLKVNLSIGQSLIYLAIFLVYAYGIGIGIFWIK